TCFGTPTWMAARPMPGAAYIVSSMSAISARKPSSTLSTGFEISFRRGSGAVMISRIAMGPEISPAGFGVKTDAQSPGIRPFGLFASRDADLIFVDLAAAGAVATVILGLA